MLAVATYQLLHLERQDPFRQAPPRNLLGVSLGLRCPDRKGFDLLLRQLHFLRGRA